MSRTFLIRVATVVVAGSLAASLAACGKGQQDEPGKNETPAQQQERKDKAGD